MSDRYSEKHSAHFHKLLGFLARVPAIRTNETPWGGFGSGESENGLWWVKLSIDVRHPLAWHTVQEMAHVLNLLSIEERLPTVFKPVSPPPYMNGGPEDYLSWVIEATDPHATPVQIAEWLEGRLPKPVDDLAQWAHDDRA
jgi:hypothetical protein